MIPSRARYKLEVRARRGTVKFLTKKRAGVGIYMKERINDLYESEDSYMKERLATNAWHDKC